MSRKPPSLAEIWKCRRTERRVFFWCFVCLSAGFLLLFGPVRIEGHAVAYTEFLPLAVYVGSLMIIHLVLVVFRSEADQLILGSVVFLAGLGILAQYRMGALDLSRIHRLGIYAYPLGIGMCLAVWAVFRRGRWTWLERLALPAGGLSLAVLGAILVTGERFRGSIYAPGMRTPSEILKVLVILFVAGQLARRYRDLTHKHLSSWQVPVRAMWPVLVFWAGLGGLLAWQRDLGLFVILSVVMVGMIFFATGHFRYLVYACLGMAVAGGALYRFFLHGQHRVMTWRDPFADPTGGGWQVLQGLSGLYAGGLWGAGFGMGDPEQIPIAKSDFIYAVIGEELGFVGCLLVVCFFLSFALRGYRIASQQKHHFPMLLVAGLTTVMVGQAFLNIAGVTKFLPLTGITLPFISHGGSSLITGFISLGLMLAVSDSRR